MIHAPRQPNRPATRTNRNGRLASPVFNPIDAIEVALPRWAANQRPTAVKAFWVIMPCPNSLSR
jgi:hypothetical protein